MIGTFFPAWPTIGSPSVSQVAVMATEPDSLAVLLNYGGLGVGILTVFYVFTSSKVHTDGEMTGVKEQHARELADVKTQRDNLMKANEALQAQLIGQTMPQMGRMVHVLEATQERYEHPPPPSPSDTDLLRQVLAELRNRDSDG